MNLTLPASLAAIQSCILVAQVVEPSAVPTGIEAISSLGIIAALVWFVRDTQTRVLPNIITEFRADIGEERKLCRELLAEARADHRLQFEKLCDEYHETSEQIASSVKEALAAVRERPKT